VDEPQRDEALRRLQDDYLRGALDAEEYARLRGEIVGGHMPAAAMPPPAYWSPAAQDLDQATGARLAGWGRRAAAIVLDWLLLVVTLIPTLIWADSTTDPVTDEISDASAGVFFAQLYLLPLLYNWLLVGAWGRTVGKMAVGIAVRRGEDAADVGYARALGRAASSFLLGILAIPLLVSYLWPLWDERNQTLHDKMANTIVVKID
jgi:uncharacterized RDD family membrane protein YckC